MGGCDVSPAELETTRAFVNGVAKDVVDEVATLGLSVEALLDGGWSGGAATDLSAGWREWKTGRARHMPGPRRHGRAARHGRT